MRHCAQFPPKELNPKLSACEEGVLPQAKDGFEPLNFLTLLSEGWDSVEAPPQPVCVVLRMEPGASRAPGNALPTELQPLLVESRKKEKNVLEEMSQTTFPLLTRPMHSGLRPHLHIYSGLRETTTQLGVLGLAPCQVRCARRLSFTCWAWRCTALFPALCNKGGRLLGV